MLIFTTLLELFFVLLWTMLLSALAAGRGAWCRLAVILAMLFPSFVLGSQLASIYSTGHYVDVLTLSNMKSYRDAGMSIVLSSAAIIVACMLLTLLAAIKTPGNHCRKHTAALIICCAAGLALCCANHEGSLRSFNRTYKTYLKQKTFRTDPKIRKIQQELYGKNETFDNDFDARSAIDLKNKNIVVIFAEGFSSEWIDRFNKYPGLTPNIDRFLEGSLYFDNYFCHTAATFRGLRGQLTSSYQTQGGYYPTNDGLGQISSEQLRKTLSGNLVSIPHILNENGYHPYFLSAHEKKEQLNQMLKTLEFGRVYGADDFYP